MENQKILKKNQCKFQENQKYTNYVLKVSSALILKSLGIFLVYRHNLFEVKILLSSFMKLKPLAI